MQKLSARLLVVVVVLGVLLSSCFLLGLAGVASIEVYNNLSPSVTNSNSIGGLYCKKSSENDWGMNYMNYEIAPGYNGQVDNLPVGIYDVKIVTTSAAEYIYEAINLEDTGRGAVYRIDVP